METLMDLFRQISELANAGLDALQEVASGEAAAGGGEAPAPDEQPPA